MKILTPEQINENRFSLDWGAIEYEDAYLTRYTRYELALKVVDAARTFVNLHDDFKQLSIADALHNFDEHSEVKE